MASHEQTSLSLGDTTTASVPSGANALERSTAAAQIAGFVYQFHLAIDALFDLKPGQALGIEVLDDFHVETEGVPESLSQVKLHHEPGALTDGAADLWKTLGIWARAVTDGSLDISAVRRLYLITTATLPAGSIGALVAAESPAQEIADRLLAVPRSESTSLCKDFDAVHALEPEDLVVLAGLLLIRGDAAPLAEVPEMLHRRLHRAGFHAETLVQAREALVGWVEGRVVPALAERRGPLITEEEFHLALTNIRDRFVRDVLPARHVDESKLTEAEYAGQTSTVFVRQLEVVNAPASMVRRAIRDYLRAVKERTTWIDRMEILPDRLRMYDQELVEKWEPLHEASCEACVGGDEAALQVAGLQHYRTVSAQEIKIDSRWQYGYLMTGSYHELANARRVGWHPRYPDLLAPQSALSKQEDETGAMGDPTAGTTPETEDGGLD